MPTRLTYPLAHQAPFTAGALWDANWHGHGGEETLHLTQTTDATILIGELQVVSRYTSKPCSSEPRPRLAPRPSRRGTPIQSSGY